MGGCGACGGGLWELTVPRQAAYLTWDVAPSWYFHANPSTHLLCRKQSQGVFLLSHPSHLSLKHRAFNLCLVSPSRSHGVSAKAFAMHPSGLPLALTLE